VLVQFLNQIIVSVRPSWYSTSSGLDWPAASGEYGPDCTNRFPRVAHEEGDVTQLRHARQEPHVLISSTKEFSLVTGKRSRGEEWIKLGTCNNQTREYYVILEAKADNDIVNYLGDIRHLVRVPPDPGRNFSETEDFFTEIRRNFAAMK
jgi:hypothetical protein